MNEGMSNVRLYTRDTSFSANRKWKVTSVLKCLFSAGIHSWLICFRIHEYWEDCINDCSLAIWQVWMIHLKNGPGFEFDISSVWFKLTTRISVFLAQCWFSLNEQRGNIWLGQAEQERWRTSNKSTVLVMSAGHTNYSWQNILSFVPCSFSSITPHSLLSIPPFRSKTRLSDGGTCSHHSSPQNVAV